MSPEVGVPPPPAVLLQHPLRQGAPHPAGSELSNQGGSGRLDLILDNGKQTQHPAGSGPLDLT